MTKAGFKADLHLYERVVRDIQTRVQSGELEVGTRLPPIRDLSVHYECNYHTIRRAMKSLGELGLVESIKGSGTYIRGDQDEVRVNSNEQKVISVLLMSEETPFSNHLCGVLQDSAVSKSIKTEWHFVRSLRELVDNQNLLSNLSGDAILIPWFRETDAEISALTSLENNLGLPVVSQTRRHQDDLGCYRSLGNVEIDNKNASHLVCEYFCRCGLKNLVLVGNANEAHDSSAFQYRMSGFQEYCLDHELTNLIYLHEKERPDPKMLLRFIERYKGEVGLVCFHDDVAVTIMRLLKTEGYVIPQDLGIIGFNDQKFCEDCDPPLSSVGIDVELLAQGMLDHTLARIHHDSAPYDQPLSLSLKVRSSCGGQERCSKEDLVQFLGQ